MASSTSNNSTEKGIGPFLAKVIPARGSRCRLRAQDERTILTMLARIEAPSNLRARLRVRESVRVAARVSARCTSR